jgi:undecaprenyl-diphosphatase
MPTFIDNVMQAGGRLDGNILLWIQDNLRFDWLTPIMQFITFIGVGFVWGALALVFLIMKRYRSAGVMMIIAMAIGFLITNIVLKNIVARPRPFTVGPSFGLVSLPDFLGNFPKDSSFPSGHTTVSVAAALAAAFSHKVERFIKIPGIVLSILVIFSRLYLGVHYPSDIVGGILVGVFGALVAELVMRKWDERRGGDMIVREGDYYGSRRR